MILRVGELHIDEPQQRVSLRGRAVKLRPLDVRVLIALARESDRALSRESLARALWGPDSAVDARALDVCVGRIRRALEASGDAIVTVRRVGYRLDPGRLSA